MLTYTARTKRAASPSLLEAVHSVSILRSESLQDQIGLGIRAAVRSKPTKAGAKTAKLSFIVCCRIMHGRKSAWRLGNVVIAS